jgi:calcineurin-like phosphoesterase family protein
MLILVFIYILNYVSVLVHCFETIQLMNHMPAQVDRNNASYVSTRPCPLALLNDRIQRLQSRSSSRSRSRSSSDWPTISDVGYPFS